MMNRRTLLLAAFIALPGCATIADVEPVEPERTSAIVTEKNYRIGVPMTATVGETIVRVKQFRERISVGPAVRAEEDVTISGNLTRRLAAKGETFPIEARREIDGLTYSLFSVGGVTLQIAPDGSIYPKSALGGGGSNPWFDGFGVSFEPANPRFVRVLAERRIREAAGLNYELVYTGTDGQGRRFQYREYTPDDLARPAFSQDLSYPASATTIRFRKLVIEILESTPDSIRYRVAADE